MSMELPMSSSSPLTLYGETFTSRLLLGTSRYPSPSVLLAAIERAQPAMLTASLRRQTGAGGEASQSFWNLLREAKVPVLPNTAGCHSMQEAITTAEMAREVFNTDWIKLELIGDDYTLQPDTLNLPEAASRLIKAGFKVLPYCTEDLVLCQRLVDVGCQAVMPWAQDPVAMAGAFADAVQAGHDAYLAGAMQAQDTAQPSTPVLGTPFWHHS